MTFETDSKARAVLEPALKHFKRGHDTRDVQAAINALFARPN
jgi:hypothetical protein